MAREAAEAGAPSCGRPGIDVLRFLDRLPENYRQALRLYYMEEKSYQEVATLLELPLGTVKTYLHRGRKELAEAVMRSKMDN